MPKAIEQPESQKWQGYLLETNSSTELTPLNEKIIKSCVQKLKGEEIAPENPNMQVIITGIAGNSVEITYPEKGTVYHCTFKQIIEAEKIILYWLRQKKSTNV